MRTRDTPVLGKQLMAGLREMGMKQGQADYPAKALPGLGERVFPGYSCLAFEEQRIL